jgi:hypothetical protein
MSWADGVRTKVRTAFEKMLMDVGEEIKADIQESISTPVEYTSRGEIIRSLPGEPPRFEFGELYESIYYTVDDDNDTRIVLTVTTNRDPRVALALENGTEDGRIEERPYFAPARQRAQARQSIYGEMVLENLKVEGVSFTID